jgi:flagella basal body P-ring formation protein FlgA
MTPRLPPRIRRIGLIAYLALIALLAIPTLARADEIVALRAAPEARGETIALSDLFEGVPAELDAQVARAPAPGAALTLDPAQLQSLVRRKGLHWANAEGLQRVVVRRPSLAVTTEELTTLIGDALVRREHASFIVTLANAQALHAPIDATLAPEVLALTRDPLTHAFAADVALGPALAPVRVTGRAEPAIAMPVLAGAIARGATIGIADLAFVETPQSRVPADAVTDPGLIVGLAARRALRPGVALKGFDLERPAVIAKNDIVIVRYESGALSLTARARALDDVAQGEQARFVNLQSNRVIEAVAAGPGEARLVAAAPSGAYISFAGGQP